MKRFMFAVLLIGALGAGSADATPIFEETFDDGDYAGWTITKTVNGSIQNVATRENGGYRPGVTYKPDMIDEGGGHKPWISFDSALVGVADTDGDGTTSPALLMRVGSYAYESSTQGRGAMISREFAVAEAGSYRVRATAMAIPYVPYWQFLSGGRFGLIVDGVERSVFDAGWLGMGVTEHQSNPLETGAKRATLEAVMDLDAGMHTLAFSITRTSAVADIHGPAQLLDDIMVMPALAPLPAPPPPQIATTPLPPAAALLAAAIAVVAGMAGRRRR